MVDGGEEMTLRTHVPFDGTMEDLPTARVLLAVPRVARASMKTPQLMERLEDVRSFHQCVIVIRQHTPRNRAGGVFLKQFEQRGGEGVHALRGVADV